VCIYYVSDQSKMQLLYQGSRDGFKAADFSRRCCNQGPTLTIVKVRRGRQRRVQLLHVHVSTMSIGAWLADHACSEVVVDADLSVLHSAAVCDRCC
jgi:hypothetical protein